MTRKDYKLIARSLAFTRPDKRRIKLLEQWKWTVTDMCITLAADNPRFDSAKFTKACNA